MKLQVGRRIFASRGDELLYKLAIYILCITVTRGPRKRQKIERTVRARKLFNFFLYVSISYFIAIATEYENVRADRTFVSEQSNVERTSVQSDSLLNSLSF